MRKIGEWRLPANRPVACMDLTRMRQVIGRDLHGILGLAYLKNLIVQVDFDLGLGQFQSRLVPEEVRGYEGMSFVYDSRGCMRIVAKVGEAESQSFIVDTGCSHTGILMRPLFTRLVESRQLRITGKRIYTTVSDHGSSPEGRLSDLVVGSFVHHNLRFCSGDENTLGLGYLRRYRMVIDFPQRKIYLAKGKQFADLDREDLSGLHLLSKGGSVAVASVDEASPAALAGIWPGDAILEIQGKSAPEIGLARIRQILRSGPDERITTVIARGGIKTDVTFRLGNDPER